MFSLLKTISENSQVTATGGESIFEMYKTPRTINYTLRTGGGTVFTGTSTTFILVSTNANNFSRGIYSTSIEYITTQLTFFGNDLLSYTSYRNTVESNNSSGRTSLVLDSFSEHRTKYNFTTLGSSTTTITTTSRSGIILRITQISGSVLSDSFVWTEASSYFGSFAYIPDTSTTSSASNAFGVSYSSFWGSKAYLETTTSSTTGTMQIQSTRTTQRTVVGVSSPFGGSSFALNWSTLTAYSTRTINHTFKTTTAVSIPQRDGYVLPEPELIKGISLVGSAYLTTSNLGYDSLLIKTTKTQYPLDLSPFISINTGNTIPIPYLLVTNAPATTLDLESFTFTTITNIGISKTTTTVRAVYPFERGDGQTSGLTTRVSETYNEIQFNTGAFYSNFTLNRYELTGGRAVSRQVVGGLVSSTSTTDALASRTTSYQSSPAGLTSPNQYGFSANPFPAPLGGLSYIAPAFVKFIFSDIQLFFTSSSLSKGSTSPFSELSPTIETYRQSMFGTASLLSDRSNGSFAENSYSIRSQDKISFIVASSVLTGVLRGTTKNGSIYSSFSNPFTISFSTIPSSGILTNLKTSTAFTADKNLAIIANTSLQFVFNNRESNFRGDTVITNTNYTPSVVKYANIGGFTYSQLVGNIPKAVEYSNGYTEYCPLSWVNASDYNQGWRLAY